MKKSIIGMAILAIIFGTAGSCKSSEKVTEDAKQVGKDKTTEVATTLDARDVEGVIVYSKEEGDCEYTIKTTAGVMYDPINLEDRYKKNGVAVIFKFAGLRMPNRCLKANPIRIEDIRMK